MDMKLKKLKEDDPSTIDESLGSNGSASSEEEDKMTKRKNEAMQAVFKIPSVLQQIIEGLKDLSDLKTCRRVSSTWMAKTSKVITNRNSCQVVITYDKSMGKFRRFFDKTFPRNRFLSNPFHHFLQKPSNCSDAVHHLPVLTELVRKSTHFPCATFGILDGDTRQLEMLEFFKVAGGHIKTLKLYDSFTTSAHRFHDILNVYCPNLEKLYMEKCFISKINIPCQVSNLKILSINHYHYPREAGPFDMLQCLSFPNLKMIEGFDLPRDLEQVMIAGKIHCVKELDFVVGTNNKELDQFKTFVESGPQLENLKLSLCYSLKYTSEKMKWLGLIQKLLDLSQDTLKVFSFRGIESVCRDLHFPKFPRLVEIEIDSSKTTLLVGTNGRYPYEILEAQISPNLKIIKGFNVSRDTEAVVGIGRINCVKEASLCLRGPEEMSMFEKFVRARPQLDILKLVWSFDSEESRWDRKRVWNGLLEQLLDFSKDTLQIVQYNGVGAVFEELKFPVFSKLKEIRILAYAQRIFPRGIYLTEFFPNLEILDLRACLSNSDGYKNWDTYFPPPVAFTGSLTSVKVVVITHRNTSRTFEKKLRLMCPNAQLVKV